MYSSTWPVSKRGLISRTAYWIGLLKIMSTGALRLFLTSVPCVPATMYYGTVPLLIQSLSLVFGLVGMHPAGTASQLHSLVKARLPQYESP